MIQPFGEQQTTIKHFRFNRGKKLGKGVTGSVYHGMDTMTGREVAVKVINMREIDNEAKSYLLKSEQNAMIGLKHPNIISCFDVIQEPSQCYIVLQYCPEGTLDDYIKKAGQVPEQDALRIFRQLVSAYKTMAQEGVVHRDLKPTNILMSNGCPKISDFGFCEIAGSVKPKMFYNVGSPSYMSPEAYMDNIYSEKSDVWSLGCILYEMVVGKTIDIGRRDITTLYDYIKSGKQFIPSGLSELSSGIIARCFTLNPRRRIGILEIDAILNNVLGPMPLQQSIVNNSLPTMNQLPVMQGSPTKQVTFGHPQVQQLLSSNGIPHPASLLQPPNIPQNHNMFGQTVAGQLPTTNTIPSPPQQVQLVQATPAQLPSILRSQQINPFEPQPSGVIITPAEPNLQAPPLLQTPLPKTFRSSTVLVPLPKNNQNIAPQPLVRVSTLRPTNYEMERIRSVLPAEEAIKTLQAPQAKPGRSKTPSGLRPSYPANQNKIKKSIVDEGSWLAGHMSRENANIQSADTPMPLILPEIPVSGPFGQPNPSGIYQPPVMNPMGRVTRIVDARNRSPEVHPTPYLQREAFYMQPMFSGMRPAIFR